MFDMSTPFSTFNSDKVNGADLAIMQREMDIEGAAHYLADLYFDDVDIDDEIIFRNVLKFYNLLDASKKERARIYNDASALITKRKFD